MQYSQILPENKLKESKKILFIIHLAIGDFTYMQNGFRAFKRKYPDIDIDLFIMESRCTNDPSKWVYLKNYVLYDWLEECGYFNKIYRENYSPDLLQASIGLAQEQMYPIVVTLGTIHSEPTEILGRKIAGSQGLLVGLKIPIKWYKFKYKKIKGKSWKVLDLSFYSKSLLPGEHISQVYNSWFEQLGGISLNHTQRLPFVNIPEKWLKNITTDLLKYKESIHQPHAPVVFINNIAKDPKRSWRLGQAIELIKKMQEHPKWMNAIFIMNTLPELKEFLEHKIYDLQISNCLAFSATNNFYELPSILSCSTLIISVETSVIHLANAVEVPVIALMRQRTPDWEPLNKKITSVIWCKNKKDNIEDIHPNEVFNVVKNL